MILNQKETNQKSEIQVCLGTGGISLDFKAGAPVSLETRHPWALKFEAYVFGISRHTRAYVGSFWTSLLSSKHAVLNKSSEILKNWRYPPGDKEAKSWLGFCFRNYWLRAKRFEDRSPRTWTQQRSVLQRNRPQMQQKKRPLAPETEQSEADGAAVSMATGTYALWASCS